MKIIKRGHDPLTETHRAVCRKCETVFEFDRKETTYVPDQRDGDFLQIDCPVCGKAFAKAV